MLTATILLYVLILVSFWVTLYQVATNKRGEFEPYYTTSVVFGVPCYFLAMRNTDSTLVFYGIMIVMGLSLLLEFLKTMQVFSAQSSIPNPEESVLFDNYVIPMTSVLLLYHHFTRTGGWSDVQTVILFSLLVGFVAIAVIECGYSAIKWILCIYFKFGRYLGRKIKDLPTIPLKRTKVLLGLFVVSILCIAFITMQIHNYPAHATFLEKTQYLLMIPWVLVILLALYSILKHSMSFLKAGMQLSVILTALAVIVGYAVSLTLLKTPPPVGFSSPFSVLGSFAPYFLGVFIFSLLWNLYCCMADAKIASLFNKIMATVTAGFVFFLNLIILAQPSTATFGMSSEAVTSLAKETGFSPSGLLALSVSALFGSLVLVYAMAALLLEIKLLWEQRTIQQ